MVGTGLRDNLGYQKHGKEEEEEEEASEQADAESTCTRPRVAKN